MNAIALLTLQHRDIAELFQRFERAPRYSDELLLFEQLADGITVHCLVEERHFYPAVRAADCAGAIAAALDAHLLMRRLVVRAMASVAETRFTDVVAALQAATRRHVELEEARLFPEAAARVHPAELELLGERMHAEATRLLAGGAPRQLMQAALAPPAPPP
jgi:hypothetical protein